MPALPPSLLEVRTGHARRIDGQFTAYGKMPRKGPVQAHMLGLEGDEVANTRVHGGPEKAIYAYGADLYPLWAADHPQHAAKLVFGGFGENLVIAGLTEADVSIGDRWRIGTTQVEVCQPRQPCNTLARWFSDPQMVRAMVANGRSGWYLRVSEPGALEAGNALTLEERLPGAFSIARVLEISYAADPDTEALAALASHPRLATSWAAWAGRQAKAKAPKAKPL